MRNETYADFYDIFLSKTSVVRFRLELPSMHARKGANEIQSRATRSREVVVDTWKNDDAVAICSNVDAAAAFAMFLNGDGLNAKTVRKAFLESRRVD
jgi:hypothetical protein